MESKLKKVYLPSEITLCGKTYIPDSDEEYYYARWIEALIELGYIDHAQRPDTVPLNDGVVMSYSFPVRRKTEHREINITNIGVYTGDMEIFWNKRAHGIFYYQDGDSFQFNISRRTKKGKNYYFHYADENGYSLVDVKGSGVNPKHHSSSSFDRIQQLVQLATGHPVQKIIPLGKKGLFAALFSPHDYFYTPKGQIKKPETWILRDYKTFIDEYTNPLSSQQCLTFN